jgi:hypothetical protein
VAITYPGSQFSDLQGRLTHPDTNGKIEETGGLFPGTLGARGEGPLGV